MPIDVIKLDVALEGLELTMDQVSEIISTLDTRIRSNAMFHSSSTCVFFADVIISNHSKV